MLEKNVDNVDGIELLQAEKSTRLPAVVTVIKIKANSLTTNTEICFKCKQTGHYTDSCPESTDTLSTPRVQSVVSQKIRPAITAFRFPQEKQSVPRHQPSALQALTGGHPDIPQVSAINLGIFYIPTSPRYQPLTWGYSTFPPSRRLSKDFPTSPRHQPEDYRRPNRPSPRHQPGDKRPDLAPLGINRGVPPHNRHPPFVRRPYA